MPAGVVHAATPHDSPPLASIGGPVPRVTETIRVRRRPDDFVSRSDSDPMELERLPRSELPTVDLCRCVFAEFDSLEGVLSSLVIWVERPVVKAAEDGRVDWSDVVDVVQDEQRPALSGDFEGEV